jgi:hypothetical protein
MEYTLCANSTESGLPCPFFIEENYSHIESPEAGYSKYVHLHRGDEADEAMDDHEPLPGECLSLDQWKTEGPLRVRERFTR